MKKLLWFLWILIFLLAGTVIFVSIVLYKPDWFSFQPSFSGNVSALAMMLTALMTLILASATFHTIKNSNEQEKCRREEELAREKRDRKERLLNEIIEWASKGISLCALHKIRNKPMMVETKYQRVAELLNLYYKKDEILVLAKYLDNRLVKSLNAAIKSLEEYLGKGTGILYLRGENEGEEIISIDPEIVTDFENKFKKLLKVVSEIKTELLN